MTEQHRLPTFPPAATVEELRDYLDAHCKAGRGAYFPEVRSHMLAVPPKVESHDDDLRLVFLSGYY